ncbi:MAG: NAD(P)-dependent alcohol dehydrogenase [Elusimicrobia bacterium]|nr:NAD(P)-dependent alcohol dehydrogenase [Elusimicrobiota bacterium]
MSDARAYAASSPTAPLAPMSLTLREPGPKDVVIDIAYCGICHSDVHTVRGEWGAGAYPIVPGHEIVGRVARVGKKVKKVKVGDLAGVGCMVDSCRKCENCRKGLEQHCFGPASFTYNSTEQDKKTVTQGGYSSQIVVNEAFALKVKSGLPLERVAPLLCAGITTYSPLKRHGVKKGTRVGVLGLGGLGHMAVKIAAAMGAKVTVLSGSQSKRPDAKKLGAAAFALTKDPAVMTQLAGTMDLIIDTVSGPHDVAGMLGLLATGGTLVMVGASPQPHAIGSFPLIMGRRAIEGSLIGGIKETQEMLDFCAKKKVLADVEVIAAKDINAAYERMLKSDVRYRFAIDCSTL